MSQSRAAKQTYYSIKKEKCMIVIVSTFWKKHGNSLAFKLLLEKETVWWNLPSTHMCVIICFKKVFLIKASKISCISLFYKNIFISIATAFKKCAKPNQANLLENVENY